MVEHDEVVAGAELVDGVGFEALQRLDRPVHEVTRRGEGVVAAWVVPCQSGVGHDVSATVPEANSSSIAPLSRPASLRISRVCSPVSGAPRSMRGGVAENL